MASSEGGQATTSSLYSTSTLESARKAKVSMETFYENLLIQDRDRSNRWKKLELSMEEMGLSAEEV
ncbi:Serine/threonine-protein kinase 38-like [Geodia barretti]|uniref:Serine/threonine-protein kinase 38-like n=1 Tax=Geodia barretti TaxID=519541 RepID=A0AA35X9P0_GEOBA|nr:Serine/threonine-protein kinase 38-like [Geodia barretti]